jgi:hypothetical protein
MSFVINDLNESKALDKKAMAAVMNRPLPKVRFALLRQMTYERLQKENLAFAGTGGVSEGNRSSGFLPAFCDTQTGRAVLARFRDGTPAPIHVLDGLPDEWVVECGPSGRVLAIKASIIAGFLHQGRFYTREQAARAIAH